MNRLKWIQYMTICKYQKMKVLMNLSQFILEKKKDKSIQRCNDPKYRKNLHLQNQNKSYYITQWRPVYEVIDEAYIKEYNIFSDDFIRECKK